MRFRDSDKRPDQQVRPALVAEESTAPPSGAGDHVGLSVIGCVLSFRFHYSLAGSPSAAKAARLTSHTTRLEAVPFQTYSCNSSTMAWHCPGHESVARGGSLILKAVHPLFVTSIGKDCSQNPA